MKNSSSELSSEVPKYVRLARARQQRDLEELKGYYFDRSAGERVVEFFQRYIYHWKGDLAGQPLILEEWQAEDLIIPIFGWKRKKDGKRRFRIAYIEVPRGNGKTFLAGGGVGLYLVLGDGENGAEVYSAATKRDQAKRSWEDAEESIRRSKRLRKYLSVWKNSSTIVCEKLGSRYQPLSSKAHTLDSLNVHGGIIDELHEHRNSDVYDKIRTGTGKRSQPLIFIITTAGEYDTESVGWKEHRYAQQVLEGAVKDESYFAYISSADEGDPPGEVSTWKKANPNYGVSVNPEYLENEWTRAKATGSVHTFERYHLNRWNQRGKQVISMEDWRACGGKVKAEGPCFAGIDFAAKVDFTAFCLYFPETFSALWKFWIPEAAYRDRSNRYRGAYEQWRRRKHLKVIPGEMIRNDQVMPEILELCDKYQPEQIGFDPWNAREIVQDLDDAGCTMIEVKQTYSFLSEATKEFLARVKTREFRHGNNGVATWMASNFTTMEDANGNMKPDKRSSAEKIDGIVALIIAWSNALREGSFDVEGFVSNPGFVV